MADNPHYRLAQRIAAARHEAEQTTDPVARQYAWQIVRALKAAETAEKQRIEREARDLAHPLRLDGIPKPGAHWPRGGSQRRFGEMARWWWNRLVRAEAGR